MQMAFNNNSQARCLNRNLAGEKGFFERQLTVKTTLRLICQIVPELYYKCNFMSSILLWFIDGSLTPNH